jgi:hypothetical protein
MNDQFGRTLAVYFLLMTVASLLFGTAPCEMPSLSFRIHFGSAELAVGMAAGLFMARLLRIVPTA